MKVEVVQAAKYLRWDDSWRYDFDLYVDGERLEQGLGIVAEAWATEAEILDDINKTAQWAAKRRHKIKQSKFNQVEPPDFGKLEIKIEGDQ